MKDPWKWIAGVLVAFLLGGGGTALFGQFKIAELEKDLKVIHNQMAQRILDNENRERENDRRLVKIETMLKTDLLLHHPEIR